MSREQNAKRKGYWKYSYFFASCFKKIREKKGYRTIVSNPQLANAMNKQTARKKS